MTSLLDVNVLVALFDADHVHHELAHDWFAENRSEGWATCPVTENGLVRVLTHPGYGSPVSTVPAILERFRTFRASGQHEFWADEISLADETLFVPALVRGHRQLTNIYLLGLAYRRGARLGTFDRSIPVGAVRGASEHTLAVVAPAGEEERAQGEDSTSWIPAGRDG